MNIRFSFTCIFTLFCANGNYAQDGYLHFRGNSQRTSEAAKAEAWDKRTAWTRPLLKDKLDAGAQADPDDDADALIKMLRKGAADHYLPGGFPLIVKDLCIYRSHRDVRAAALQPLEFKDQFGVEKIEPGSIAWKSIAHDTSLSRNLELKSRAVDLQRVIIGLQAGKLEHLLWTNATIGALASDGVNVYAIDDLVFPSIDNNKPMPGGLPAGFGDLTRYAKGNDLHVYDVITGKLEWDTTYNPGKRQSPFANTHILGAPLVVDGKLFLLNEKANKLRLLVIDLDRKKWQNPVNPEIEKTLVLMKIPAGEQIAKSPMRRTQGLHLARAGDLLVCPTHAGELIGVDFVKMTVRWQYRYRNANVPPSAQPYWHAACPIAGKEHIVFTAADAPDVHCVGVDGKKKWTAAVDGGVYLATVFDDHALVVGKGMCRALKLSDGTEKWKLEMGAPAGLGVRAEARYYLPLKKDAINEAPTIWAIDLAKGSKLQRVAVPHPLSLGNLALHRGMLVLQSVTHIAAFPLPPSMPDGK